MVLEVLLCFSTFEPLHDKTYKMTCAPSEHSDQPDPSSLGAHAVLLVLSRGGSFLCVHCLVKQIMWVSDDNAGITFHISP